MVNLIFLVGNPYLLVKRFSFKGMWNVFLPYAYCTIKFIYVVVPSIVVETVGFFWPYLENNMSQWLQMWRHQFWQAKEATSEISEPELSPVNKMAEK